MAELKVHLDLTFGERGLRWALTGAMILASVPELASENVTMTTYYPAPSGVYTSMITTSDTYLARDGGKVGLATIHQKSLLSVKGGMAVGSYADTDAAPANGLIVSGSVGIGTKTPGYALDINGDAGVTGKLTIKDGSQGLGYILTSDANGKATWSNSGGWPPGSYCIIQAVGKACPAGFNATNPAVGALAPNGSGEQSLVWGSNASAAVPNQYTWGMSHGNGGGPSQYWAWCCK